MESLSRSASQFRFGEFEADLRSGELRKNGIRIKVQEQPFQILASLLERPGDVVTRDELRKRLWPAGIHLDFENGLNIAVKKLRQALGDDSETPRFIETLPKRGYRFIAPVQSVMPPPSSEAFAPVASDRVAPRAAASAPMANRARRGAILAATAIVLMVGVAFVWRTAKEGGGSNSPIRSLAVLPLQKNKEELVTTAKELHNHLKRLMVSQYDDVANIGRRYRRQDEIGTPFCFTIDGQTLQDQTVTIRERDTTKQWRIAIGAVSEELKKRLR